MSMKKVALSFALAGILGASSMLAETDGAFVGVQAGFGSLENSIDYTQSESGTSNTTRLNSKTSGAFRYGFVAGYKQFFTPEFGLRYYASFDFGTDYNGGDYKTDENKTHNYKVSTMNFDANVDALYNFVSSANLDLGAFVGVGLGYVNHNFKKAKPNLEKENTFEDFKTSGFDLAINFGLRTNIAKNHGIELYSGFDLAINFGLRTNIAKNHGIELYSRFALLEHKKDEVLAKEETGKMEQTFKAKQPYQVGLRYTFSF